MPADLTPGPLAAGIIAFFTASPVVAAIGGSAVTPGGRRVTFVKLGQVLPPGTL